MPIAPEMHGELPATYQRLVALKDAYDPDKVFRLNQNVTPSRTRQAG